MFLFDFFFAMAIAAIVTALFTLFFDRRGPWESWPIFFLLIFLVAWAGGVWVTPTHRSACGGNVLVAISRGSRSFCAIPGRRAPPTTTPTVPGRSLGTGA